MPSLPQFATPANLADLTGSQQNDLNQQWSDNVKRWTESSILGDPWTSLNDSNRHYYYNPLTTDVSDGISAPISWIAFPNRILLNFPNATFTQQMGYAEGVHDDGTFGPPPNVQGQPYGPRGPRGWQDEYCEWISSRDASGKITSVDFTCENPEYWFSVWRINPQRVLALYQELIGPTVKIEDLFLRDAQGQPVIDRATGFAAYDAVNKWNNQPSANQKTGVAHLISPPNTLGAEIYLAAAATLLREDNNGPITDPDQLIQCSRYGTAGRNSDPHIGSEVNKIINGGGVVASLQDPIGLYIQSPDFSGYSLPSDPQLPADADVSECWNVIRGSKKGVGDNIDFILHARFEIPKRWKDAGVSFTVGDIQISGNSIQFGAQITQTFQIALRGFALKTNLPVEPLQPCQAQNPKRIPAPQAVQDMNLFAVNSTSAAVTLCEQASTVANIAIFTVNATKATAIAFTGDTGVKVTVTDFQAGQGQLFTVTLDIEKNAPLGDRALQLTNPDGSQGPAAPGMLSIVPPGTLGKQVPPSLAKGMHPAADVLAEAEVATFTPAAPTGHAKEKAMMQRLQARRAPR